MIRTLAKSTACRALALTRLAAWIEQGVPVVVGYHQVVADEPAGVMPGLAVSARMLARHLDWIGQRCRFVGLDELAGELARKRPGRPACAVTFDDGYAGVLHHGLPVLAAKGVPAAVFVVTGAAGAPLVHDRLYRALAARGDADPYASARALLAGLAPDAVAHVVERIEAELPPALPPAGARTLTWPEIRALHAAGLTIGSHTVSHARLVGLPPERLAAELAESRRALADALGASIDHLAYPDGQFDAAVLAAVERAGYRYAYTVCRHRDPARPLLTIPRTMLWERSSLGVAGRFSGAVLGCQLHGELAFLDRCRREHVRCG